MVRTVHIALLGLGTLGHFACEPVEKTDSSKVIDPAPELESDEPSPNARILPEPLKEGVPAREEEEEIAQEEAAARTKPRAKPRPFSFDGPLADDSLKRGVGNGFEMQLRVTWSEAKKNLTVGEQELGLWPTFRAQLLKERPDQPARLRLIMEGQGFPYPPATELRARADRIGHVVLWPNQRSYRVAPPGSLHSIFADRRVDRVPFVEVERRFDGRGSRLGKETKKVGLSTPIGSVNLEFVDVKELPYASGLLCGALLEMVRVRATPEICPQGALPVHFEFSWLNEEKLEIAVLSWGAIANFKLDEFRLPPDLPIFKPGELPPFDDYFLEEQLRQELLPLTQEKAERIIIPAPEAPEGKPKAPDAPPPPPTRGPPKNEVVLKNELNRPLVVLLNQVPFVWLSPGDRLPIYLKGDDVRVSARDFLGETIFTERTLTAPAQLQFGGAEEEPPQPIPAQ